MCADVAVLYVLGRRERVKLKLHVTLKELVLIHLRTIIIQLCG